MLSSPAVEVLAAAVVFAGVSELLPSQLLFLVATVSLPVLRDARCNAAPSVVATLTTAPRALLLVLRLPSRLILVLLVFLPLS